MMESILFWGSITLLVSASAFFSGSEVALFSLSSIKVKTYKEDPDPKKRLIAELLERPKDLLVTIFMLNTAVNILLQNVFSSLFGEAAGWELKVGVPLAITLIFGEILPKNLCMQNNDAVASRVVRLIHFFHKSLTVLRKFTIAIAYPVSKVLFFGLRKEEKISEEELEHMLETSEKHGVLHPDEATLVWGYLKLHTATTKEVLVPKEDVLYYDIQEPITKLTHLFVEQECSRIPVTKGNLDHVLGVIDAKDFFLHAVQIREGASVLDFTEKPFFVPETTSVQSLMKQFSERRQVLALTIDEYGSVTGLVSREDIVELVIGEISDKRNTHPLYTVAGDNEIIASGKFELAEFNEHFDVRLESPENMVTIGGWLIEKVGEIPKAGNAYDLEGFLFQILSSDPRRIKRLYIRKKAASKPLITPREGL